jgi:RND family efflux transporter MFP subunit
VVLCSPPRALLRAFAFCVLGSSVGGCGGDAPAPAETAAVVGVTVAEARVETLRDVASAPGTIVPSVAGDWTVYASETGEIVELPRQEGDTVVPGDLLVRFEIASATQEAAALELQLLEARTRLQRAEANLERQTSLNERGLTSRNEYENSRLELSTAKSQLAQAEMLAQSARSTHDRTVVRARFSGQVVKVWHAPGDMVNGGASDPVLRVIDPSRLQVAMQLPIVALARVVPGQAATVRAIAGSVDEQAVVASKPAAADANAPTGEVRLSFVAGSILPIDTPVSAEILLEQRTDAIVVPATAVQRDELASYVMVAADDNRARRRDVRVGLVTRDQAQIAAGLDAGERVIVGGLQDVEDGSLIAYRK